MARREFSGAAAETTLAGDITASSTSITIADATNWPSGAVGPFAIVIARGTANEEKVLVTSRSGTTLTCTLANRGYDDTTAASHSSGVAVEHCLTAVDLDEANEHINDTTGAHAATAISAATHGAIAGTTVQAQLEELESEKLATTAHDTRDHSTALGTAVLADLSDVAATAPSDGQALVYDTTNGWQPETITTTDRALVGGFVGYTGNFTTASQMRRLVETGSGTTVAAFSFVMDRAGSIVGINANMQAARTAGTLVFEVFKNGTGVGLTCTIDGTNTQYVYATQAAGTDTFVAGDRLDVRVTKTGFLPDTGCDSTITVAYS